MLSSTVETFIACGRIAYDDDAIVRVEDTGVSPGVDSGPGARSCSDGMRNGTETDLDCGGECGATCDLGRSCAAPGDCMSVYCNTLGRCAEPTCMDSVQNGTETGVDCGGRCPACETPPRTWTTVAAAPPGRLVSAAMAYHAGRGAIVLYGGVDHTGNTVAGTWEYDGRSWVPMSCNPSCAPGTRGSFGLAYDSGRDRIVMFGGSRTLTGPTLGDLWEYDSTGAWQSVTASGAPPFARAGAYMAYDPNRERMVIFGGVDASGMRLDDVYEYDGASWYGPLTPGTRPTPRMGVASGATFAPAGASVAAIRDQVLVFGGDPFTDDLWGWNGTTWRMICNSCTGTPRGYAGLIYEPTSRDLLLVAGYAGFAAELSGTWEYLGGSWTRTSVIPASRDSMAIAFDPEPAGQKVVMFGGNGPSCAGAGDREFANNCGETLETSAP